MGGIRGMERELPKLRKFEKNHMQIYYFVNQIKMLREILHMSDCVMLIFNCSGRIQRSPYRCLLCFVVAKQTLLLNIL